jgi:cobalt-zinc-cadmium efflux system outer membrane protein
MFRHRSTARPVRIIVIACTGGVPMQRHMAGIMVLLLAVSPSLHAEWPSSAATLTLDVAFKKALERHPDLQVLPLQRVRLLAESEVAAQRPALVGGINIENALGTGEFSGLSGAEVSLTLASVLERGGKREARTALATSRLNGFAVEGEATRLDLLAEVARRYLDVVLAQASEEIAVAAVEQKRRTVAGARRRVEAFDVA